MRKTVSKGVTILTKDRKTLHQLFFPIFFEILCSILTGVVDTLMLSSEGDQAVGAVGTANSYISIFVIMFSIAVFLPMLNAEEEVLRTFSVTPMTPFAGHTGPSKCFS